MVLDDGAFGRAAVPSGASTGEHEARELRDDDPTGTAARASRAPSPTSTGRSRRRSPAWMPSSSAASTGRCSTSTARPTKTALGANAILGVSLAVARAAADSAGQPLYRYLGGPNAHLLPTPMMNVINGGVHADNELELQEFMLLPVGAASFSEGAALGGGVLPCAPRPACTDKGFDRRRRRGRVRARAVHRRRGVRAAGAGDRGRRARTGRRDGDRAGPGDERALPRRRLPPRGRGPQHRRHDRVLDGPAGPVPDRVDRGSGAPRTIGRAGRSLVARARRPGAAGRRRPVRDEHRAARARDPRAARPTRS